MNKGRLAARFAGATPIAGKRLVPRLEAMHRLAIGHDHWNALAKAGILPISKIGSRVFISSETLDRLIDNPALLNQAQKAG